MDRSHYAVARGKNPGIYDKCSTGSDQPHIEYPLGSSRLGGSFNEWRETKDYNEDDNNTVYNSSDDNYDNDLIHGFIALNSDDEHNYEANFDVYDGYVDDNDDGGVDYYDDNDGGGDYCDGGGEYAGYSEDGEISLLDDFCGNSDGDVSYKGDMYEDYYGYYVDVGDGFVDDNIDYYDADDDVVDYVDDNIDYYDADDDVVDYVDDNIDYYDADDDVVDYCDDNDDGDVDYYDDNTDSD